MSPTEPGLAGARQAGGSQEAHPGGQPVEPTVIFLHIGKTAGTTLRRILRRQYSGSEIMLVRSRSFIREDTLAQFAELPAAQRTAPRLIMGHTVFGLHELIPRPCTYITMLRDPFALVPSQYSHVRRTASHRHHAHALDCTIEEYIRSGVAQEMNNSQTRALCGIVDMEYGSNPPELLDRALHNLESQFTLAGLTERFDDSLVLMQEHFGWSRIQYARANVAPRKMQMSPDLRQLIAEYNALDIALYEEATARLDRSISETPGFAGARARFERRSRLYAPWGALTYTYPQRVKARWFGRTRVSA